MSDPNNTAIGIVRRAFSVLEERGPSSLEDQGSKARLAALHYGPARRFVIASHDWGFAARTTALPPLDDPGTVPSGWSRFRRPKDCLAIYAVRDRVELLFSNGKDIPNHVEGDDIVARIANTAPAPDRIPAQLFLRYGVDEERTGLFPPFFTEALIQYLAYLMAPEIASNRNLGRDAFNTFQGIIDAGAVIEAQSAQGEANYLDPELRSDWTDLNGIEDPRFFGSGL